jgi:DNA-directed RNA polymerase subunit RPC12/RpoP
MSESGPKGRSTSEPVGVECPICRHRQWLSSTLGRCDQCSSEIELFEDRDEALAVLERLSDQGRVAFLVEPGHGLFAVVANRTFGGGR